MARETACRNGVDVDVRLADVLGDELPGVDVVVANIELRVVESLLGRLAAGIAVTSGYRAGEEPSAEGWDVLSRAELDGWGAHCWSPRRRDPHDPAAAVGRARRTLYP